MKIYEALNVCEDAGIRVDPALRAGVTNLSVTNAGVTNNDNSVWDVGRTVLNLRNGLVLAVALGTSVLLAGCATNDPNLVTASLGDTTFPEVKQPFAEGQLQFAEGHYGLAIDAFSKTVESDPKNPEAWLGLAASYDQTGRFDQADRAYQKVQQLVGPTPSVLNNLGYSYLLRGQLDLSAQTLAAAHRGDPGNPYILNNIDMLNARLAALGRPPVPVN